MKNSVINMPSMRMYRIRDPKKLFENKSEERRKPERPILKLLEDMRNEH